ncbi:MAG: hypothetical protein OEY88_09125, partial [Candidatus Bathyarchaeota archaeon]|nr:hypothetical protein [Candidatus Bathyarchaeota archaeon]
MSRRKKKYPKVKDFVKSCVAKGILSPSEMRDNYNEKYPRKVKGVIKAVSAEAFTMALRRLDISADKRLELKHKAEREKELKDIMEYEEVERYLHYSKYVGHIGKHMIDTTMRHLRTLFKWMIEEGYPNPRDWNIENLGKCMEKHVGLKENGQWQNNDRVLRIWGAFNRCFQGQLPKGWSMGLKRPAGELKDFLEYEEFMQFIDKLPDTVNMSKEGWQALFASQVNMGCREGSRGKTGIVTLTWENIDYNAKNCKIRDKGKKGKPARLWCQVPLNMFPLVNGWERLMKWHEQRYGYIPTQ